MTHDDARAGHGSRRRCFPRAPDGAPPARVPPPLGRGSGRRTSAAPGPVPGARTKPPTSLVRVLLCEDQEVFRLGLRVVLEAEPDMAVVAETAHLPAAVSAAVGAGTQVVVVRQGLVGGATLPLLRELCRGGTAVLVLAEPSRERRPDRDWSTSWQAGVRGFLPRRSAGATARRRCAVARQERGRAVRLDPRHRSARPLPERAAPRNGGARGSRALDRLTERQREVAELVAQALSNDEIAARLVPEPGDDQEPSHRVDAAPRGPRTRTQLAILVGHLRPGARRMTLR